MSPRRSLTPVLAAAAIFVLLAWPSVASAANLRVEDDDAHLRFVGQTRPVTSSAASKWGRRNLKPGASLEASFTGTSVSWIGSKAPGFGSAKVFVDGSQVATVSATGSRISERVRLWSSGTLADTTHSLRIVAIGGVSVDAVDVAGSILTAARPHPVVRVEETSPLLGFTDFFRKLTTSGASAGRMRLSRVPGTKATIEFTGTDVSWIGRRWAGGGTARVYLDGSNLGTVSLWSPSTRSNRVLFSAGGLADGPHTLTVIVLGSRERASRGNDITVDAFDVAGVVDQATRRVEDDDRRVRWGRGWKTIPGWKGDTQTRSATTAAAASVDFWGTGCAIRGVVGPAAGRASVYVDSVFKETIDLYAPSGARNTVVYSVAGLDSGPHTLTLKVLGSRDAASASNAVVIDAFDVDGEVLVPGVGAGRRRADSTRSVFARSGSWSRSGSAAAVGGSVLQSTRKNSRFYAEFVGTGFTWFGTKHSKGGRAKVIVDGKTYATVSMYSRSRVDQRAVYRVTGLKKGRHRVVIQVLGAHESASRGNIVSVDFIDVVGSFVTARRPVSFNYPWSTYIVIDKSECKLYWVKNGSLVKVYPIAVGKASTPTPERTWKILAKYYTSPGGIFGPRKMRLFKQVGSSYQYTAYNLHGTNQPWVIGTWASHGCIRMYNRDVLELFPQVPIGTMVVTRR